MEPTQTCDILIAYLKQSNLNFHIAESPFSASIEIKKTFIRDKNGRLRTSGLLSTFSSDQIEPFEDEKMTCKVDNNDSLIKDNENLQIQLSNKQNELATLKDDIKQFQTSQTISERKIENLEKALDGKKSEIILLKKSLANQENVMKTSKQEFESVKKILKAKEKEVGKLELKAENLGSNLKAVKAEVSKLKKENTKLEKMTKKLGSGKANDRQVSKASFETELSEPLTASNDSVSVNNNLEPDSSLSSLCTPSTIPVSSVTSEILSAKPRCSHSPQCVIRQPKPPPLDKSTILVHHGSKYHEHMDSEAGVPARYNTHEYCMRIDYRNYGCEDCIWFKWWGELHGFPDINPWSFKEHLQPMTCL